MKGLTAKEEEIMGFFWKKGPLFVKEMLAFYDEPKPHFNTLSTIVRGLEDKGFLPIKLMEIPINIMQRSVQKIFIKEH